MQRGLSIFSELPSPEVSLVSVHGVSSLWVPGGKIGLADILEKPTGRPRSSFSSSVSSSVLCSVPSMQFGTDLVFFVLEFVKQNVEMKDENNKERVMERC